MDHNTRDQVGVVESVTLDDRKGRAVVRFGSGARASEVFQDVIDGIRRNVSVGYRVYKMVLEESTDDDEIYRVTDWEPMEVSLVSVPADVTVGVARNETPPGETFEAEIILNQETKMEDDDKQTRADGNDPAPKIDTAEVRKKAVDDERKRVGDLMKVGQDYEAADLAKSFIENGGTVADLNAAILERNKKRGHDKGDDKQDRAVGGDPVTIGLNEKEIKQFSFVRLIQAGASGFDQGAVEAAKFELEVARATSDALQKEGVRDVRSELSVPHEILSAPITYDVDAAKRALQMMAQRDLVVGTATAGGNLVATDLLAQSFVDILRNRSVMMSVATVLSDLRGNIDIPRQTAAAVGGWLSSEQGAASEQNQAFDQISLTPKEVGAFTEYSRKLLIQSSLDIEAFVRMDLAIGLALSIDSAAINGDGTGGAPTGIRNTTGIGAVVGGTNGAAPDWDDVVNLETEVAIDNADVGRLVYLINAATRGKFKRTFIDAGSGERIWDSRAGETPVNGYRAAVTNQVPSNLTKGSGTNLSSIVFGNMADLIMAFWSGVDLLVNPYTGDTTRTTRVTAYEDMDVAVRHPESFAAMEDAITT